MPQAENLNAEAAWRVLEDGVSYICDGTIEFHTNDRVGCHFPHEFFSRRPIPEDVPEVDKVVAATGVPHREDLGLHPRKA